MATCLLKLTSPLTLTHPSPALHLSKHPPPRPCPIKCGPRDNRGPLIRGRTLSTQTILAIQALKRARGDPSKIDHVISTSLSRLFKADLLAALAELQRQNHCPLALKVFASTRREPWYNKTDHALYADMIAALARSGMEKEIDVLMLDLMDEHQRNGGPSKGDLRGLARLVKVLVAAGRGKDVREVYGMMKTGGCVPDEFLFRVMIRGLRRLGEEEEAGEVERDCDVWMDGGVRSVPMRV